MVYFIGACIGVIVVGALIALNLRYRKALKTMTPDERDAHEKDLRRISGDW